jgi:glutamyl-tRNA synthetase
MINVFDLKKIQTTAPMFDIEKLRWINGEYLRKSQKSKVKSQIYEFCKEKYPPDKIETILPLVVERMKTLGEFEPLAGFFFKRSKETERPVNTQVLKVAREAIQQSQWNHDAMEKNIRDAADKAGLKARDVFMELRLAVTGKTVGPPLLESLEILGKKETIGRLSSIE